MRDTDGQPSAEALDDAQLEASQATRDDEPSIDHPPSPARRRRAPQRTPSTSANDPSAEEAALYVETEP